MSGINPSHPPPEYMELNLIKQLLGFQRQYDVIVRKRLSDTLIDTYAFLQPINLVGSDDPLLADLFSTTLEDLGECLESKELLLRQNKTIQVHTYENGYLYINDDSSPTHEWIAEIRHKVIIDVQVPFFIIHQIHHMLSDGTDTIRHFIERWHDEIFIEHNLVRWLAFHRKREQTKNREFAANLLGELLDENCKNDNELEFLRSSRVRLKQAIETGQHDFTIKQLDYLRDIAKRDLKRDRQSKS